MSGGSNADWRSSPLILLWRCADLRRHCRSVCPDLDRYPCCCGPMSSPTCRGIYTVKRRFNDLGEPEGVLAKQVLSQLSYTPTMGTYIDGKAFARVSILGKFTFCRLLCKKLRQTPDRASYLTVTEVEPIGGRRAICTQLTKPQHCFDGINSLAVS